MLTSESLTIPFLLHTVATNLRKRRGRCRVELDYKSLRAPQRREVGERKGA